MPTRRMTIGNPAARSPLMRKGGAHRRSRSGERHKLREELEAELEEWPEKGDGRGRRERVNVR